MQMIQEEKQACDLRPGNLLVCPPRQVIADWCDYNQHMNVAFYVMLFDQSLDTVFGHLNISENYLQRGFSHFTTEGHIRYVAEVREGETLEIHYRILDRTPKLIHFYAEMHVQERNTLAATWEQLTLHVSMKTRRSAPMPEDVEKAISALVSTDDWPEGAGQVQIRRK